MLYTKTSGGFQAVGTSGGGVEVSIRAYSGLDTGGGSDISTVLAAAMSDASSYAIGHGLPWVRLGGFGKGVYRVDSNILAVPRVKLDLDDARIVAGADFGATRSGMFRAVETANSAVSVGTANIATATPRVLSNVSSIASYYPEMVISGTGITAGTKVVAIDKHYNQVAVDTDVTATSTGVAITRAATRYGNFDNFQIIGGEIDPNGKNVGAIMRLLFMNGLKIKGTRILHNLPEASANWALQIGGRNGEIDVDIIGGQWEFADGIHLAHGQNWRITGHVESGDDMVALGCETGDVYALEPDPIRNVVVQKITGRSAYAFGLKMYVQSGNTGRDYEISDVTVQGLSGRSAGTDKQGYGTVGGIKIIDYNAGAAGTSQIKRINVDGVNLRVGSALQSGLLVSELVHASSVDDVTFRDLTLTAENGVSPTSGFDVLRVEKSRDVTFDRLRVASMPKRHALWATDSQRVTLRDSTFVAATASNIPVRLKDCTDFQVLDNRFLNLVTGQPAVQVNEGTTSTGTIRRNRVSGVASDAFLLRHTAAALVRVDVGDNDITGCTRAFESTSEWALTTRAARVASPPRRVFSGRNRLDAVGAGDSGVNEGGTNAYTGSGGGFSIFYFDPAEYYQGLGTPKLRLEFLIATNNVAPAVTFTASMTAVSSPAGAAANLTVTKGSAVAGSTPTAIASPAANSFNRQTADFDPPVAGWYALNHNVSGSMAASSAVVVRETLYYLEQ